ncbi:MAG: hypothetical protein R8G66_06705 [Cytophagales bacterium]|nr:hypothetical protein [Cytophagales bacterium]
MHRNVFILVCFLSHWASAQDLDSFRTPFERYPMATQNCEKIITESGSLIYFEKDGFPAGIDSVTITYREFFSTADMIIHDIAMHTRTFGDPFQLASTGMFEIYALNGEDTIPFDPSKRMAIFLASAPGQLRKQVAPYKYDHNAGEWKSSPGQIAQRSIAEDDDLWGSSSVSFEEGDGVFFDAFDGEGGDWEEDQRRRIEAFQVMNISSFGLHNYDYLIDGVERRLLQPNFVTNTGVPVVSQIYVVYEAFNSVYYFPTYTWESEFSLLVNQEFNLFTIDTSGMIWKFTDSDFTAAELSHGASVTFTLEKTGIPDSKESLTQMAGL